MDSQDTCQGQVVGMEAGRDLRAGILDILAVAQDDRAPPGGKAGFPWGAPGGVGKGPGGKGGLAGGGWAGLQPPGYPALGGVDMVLAARHWDSTCSDVSFSPGMEKEGDWGF